MNKQQEILKIYKETGNKTETAAILGITRHAVRWATKAINIGRKTTTGKSKVLIIGDTHAPAMHKNYIEFLLDIQSKHKCDRVVHIGDLVDWNAISFHEKDPSMPSAEEEFNLASKQVKMLHKAFPSVDYMTGNHSAMPARKARLVGLPDAVMKNFKDLWQLEGWTIHPRYGDLIIDDVIYRHGDKGKGGAPAAIKNAQAEFRSVVQGHFHAQAGVVFHACLKDLVFGMQVGCGVDHDNPAMNYGKIYSAKPILGCGVVIDGIHPIFEPLSL